MAKHNKEPSLESRGEVESSVQASRFGVMAMIRWMQKHPRATAGIGGGLATLAAGTILTANIARGPADAGPAPVHTPTAESSEPTVTPTPVEAEVVEVAPETLAAYNYNIDKAEVDVMVAENSEWLLELPIEERMLAPLYYAQELPQFAADFHGISNDPNDILPPTMSADSSVEDVRTFIFYMENLIYTRGDVTTAKAIAAGLYVNGMGSDGYNRAVNVIDGQIAAGNGSPVYTAESLANGGVRAPIIKEGSVTRGVNAHNEPLYSYTSVDSDGVETVVTAVWIKSANGAGMWTVTQG